MFANWWADFILLKIVAAISLQPVDCNEAGICASDHMAYIISIKLYKFQKVHVYKGMNMEEENEMWFLKKRIFRSNPKLQDSAVYWMAWFLAPHGVNGRLKKFILLWNRQQKEEWDGECETSF